MFYKIHSDSCKKLPHLWLQTGWYSMQVPHPIRSFLIMWHLISVAIFCRYWTWEPAGRRFFLYETLTDRIISGQLTVPHIYRLPRPIWYETCVAYVCILRPEFLMRPLRYGRPSLKFQGVEIQIWKLMWLDTFRAVI